MDVIPSIIVAVAAPAIVSDSLQTAFTHIFLYVPAASENHYMAQ
jgi:hypothetical protein